jgi:hypothetical protein
MELVTNILMADCIILKFIPDFLGSLKNTHHTGTIYENSLFQCVIHMWHSEGGNNTVNA